MNQAERVARAVKLNKQRKAGGKLGDCISCGLLCRFDEGQMLMGLPQIVVLCNECTKVAVWVIEIEGKRIVLRGRA